MERNEYTVRAEIEVLKDRMATFGKYESRQIRARILSLKVELMKIRNAVKSHQKQQETNERLINMC